MRRSEFTEKIVKKRIGLIAEVLAAKADEYAVDGDFDYNFIEAARIDDITPEEALWGMAKKHLVSVMDMIHGRTDITPEKVDEKIGDLINYLILLEGIFYKKISKQNTELKMEDLLIK